MLTKENIGTRTTCSVTLDCGPSVTRPYRRGSRPAKLHMAIKTDNCDLLTPREREIVTLVAQGYRNVAQGYRNKEIAQELVISEQTVKNHLHHIFAKLGIAHRRDLALFDVHKPRPLQCS